MARDVSLEIIDDFLSQKRIAMVGISREPRSFSVSLFEELCRRGYDMVPVNPNTPNVLGHRCFARLQDIEPRVDTVILMTSPAQTEKMLPIVSKPESTASGCIVLPAKGPSAQKPSPSAAKGAFKSYPENVRTCSCPVPRESTASTASSARSPGAFLTTPTPNHGTRAAPRDGS